MMMKQLNQKLLSYMLNIHGRKLS